MRSKTPQSLSHTLVFVFGMAAGVLFGYLLVGPVSIGAVQLALDRLGDPMPDSIVRITHIAIALVTGLVIARLVTRLALQRLSKIDHR